MRARSDDIATILDVCLERIRRGESPEACLLDYPAQAAELELLLMAARHVRTLHAPALAPQARQAIRLQLHQAINVRQPAPRQTTGGWLRPFVLRFALALLVAFVGIGGGVAAAQTSLPGNSLYPLKLATENVRLRLASTSAQRATLHLNFAAARSVEILALTNAGHAIDSGLVDDLDREYQLAWEELRQAPEAEAQTLGKRYVVERQADVKLLSAVLARANAGAGPQLQRAVRLGQQALVDAASPESPATQPAPGSGGNSANTPGNNQDQGGQGSPTNGGNTGSNGSPKPGNGQRGGNKQGPQATPDTKPNNGGPQTTPDGKPNNGGPQATPDGKPDNAGSNPKPQPQPGPDSGNNGRGHGGRP